MTELTAWVYDRLERSGVKDDVALVVIAALEGDAELEGALAEGTGTLPVPVRPEGSVIGEAVEPPGTFLSELRVQGFRGIGDEVVLPFHAGPGLTVIAGRNGSGKSSLAEAMELLLTGGTYRWKNKPVLWKERWRNLHAPSGASVELDVIQEGARPTTLSTSWDDATTEVDARNTWGQEQGEKRVVAEDPLGWRRSLETFRPILSYEELGGLLAGGPSHLYDAMAMVLGVEPIADAMKRLQVRHKAAKAPGADLDKARKALRERATQVTDERAETLAVLLSKRDPDAEAVTQLVTGTGAAEPTQGVIGGLRALVNLDGPDEAAVGRAVTALRAAVERVTTVAAEESARRQQRLDLRRRAVALHSEHGDQSCPVCARGELDVEWATNARALIEREEETLDDLIRSTRELEAARAGVRRVLASRPRALDTAPVPALEQEVSAAREAWDSWSSPDLDGDQALAGHLEAVTPALRARLDALHTAAQAELAARDDQWSPLARDAAGWAREWEQWEAGAEPRATLAEAEAWLKTHDNDLKNERLAPIAQGAREAWAMLRQESNVELGELRLGGSATRRRVEITAMVDGNATDALPVMSQGELHALALALFLPRAKNAASPFRFVVLDDPVQAMDPAKVQGLVDLLADLAQTRQVVVLSHDDRLPAAVRRAQVPARILEVTRGTDSSVSVQVVKDPAERYLDDARALVRDERMPSSVVRRTIPGLLRMAIEAAARDAFFATRLARGESLEDVEDVWGKSHQTRERLSLAVFDEVRNDLGPWLSPRYRSHVLGCATSGLHSGLSEGTHLRDLVQDAGRLVGDVRRQERS